MNTNPSEPRKARASAGEAELLLSPGALLRAAADDELDERQGRRLAAHLAEFPEDRVRIEFERQLRTACARVMASEPASAGAPARLRARILAVTSEWADESPTIPAGMLPVEVLATAVAPTQLLHAGESRAPESAPAHRRHGEQAPQRVSKRRQWRLIVAALAILGLGVTAMFVAQPPTFQGSPERARVALAGFLSSEHRRCTMEERALRGKMTSYNLNEAPGKFAKLLGQELQVGRMELAGYEFLGAGRCSVPGAGDSVHLVFRDGHSSLDPRDATPLKHCDPTRLSLYIQKDTGELPMEAGVTYRLETAPNGPMAVAWLRNGLIYYLLTETSALEASALELLGASNATKPL